MQLAERLIAAGAFVVAAAILVSPAITFVVDDPNYVYPMLPVPARNITAEQLTFNGKPIEPPPGAGHENRYFPPSFPTSTRTRISAADGAQDVYPPHSITPFRDLSGTFVWLVSFDLLEIRLASHTVIAHMEISSWAADQVEAGEKLSVNVGHCGQGCPSHGVFELTSSQLVRSHGGPQTYAADLPLTLLGSPRAFPNDWYLLTIETEMFRSVHSLPDLSVPFPYRMLVSVPDSEFTTSLITSGTARDLENYAAKTGVVRTEILFERRTPASLFAYVVALAPIVLAGVILGQGMFRSLLRSGEAAALYASLAAAAVTILPLRAVIVPQEIQSFSPSRLDLLLAFEIGLFAYVAAVIYARQTKLHAIAWLVFSGLGVVWGIAAILWVSNVI